MKKSLFVLALLVIGAHSSFAQDMSRTETYESSQRDESDGSSTYVGKCKTHEHYEDDFYTVSEIMPYVNDQNMVKKEITKMVRKVGVAPLAEAIRGVSGCKECDLSTESKVVEAILDSDDFTIEKLVLKEQPKRSMIRINMGYGGGNGGYGVVEQLSDGKVKLMSFTNDHDLGYCDLSVWKK